MRKPIGWIYDRLLCEFDHWNICLSGIVLNDGERLFCKVVRPDNVEYEIIKVEWDSECEEYMEDYRAAYPHWFYENGVRQEPSRVPFGWFNEKWQHRNPIRGQFA